MISKEIVRTYLNFYNAYKTDTNRTPTFLEQEAIDKLVEEAKTNTALSQMLVDLQKENDLKEQNRKLEEYFDQLNTNEKEEEVIAKTFGIDVSNIKHQFLQNGKDIFVFYSDSLERNVVLQNSKEGESLIFQLKEMQLENEEYQTEDKSLNTKEMLKRKRMEENTQLTFLPVNQIENDKEILIKLDEKRLVQLSVLLQNVAPLHLKAINVENMLAMDEYQNIYEVYYNREKNGYTIQKPNEASYQQEKIEISNENTTADLEEVYENEYDDIPSILMHDPQLTVPVEEAMETIKMYYEYPEMLENLLEGEKKFYTKYTEMYKKYIEKQEKPKYFIKKNNFKQAGYTDALILALVTGFASGTFFTLAYFLFR